MRKPKSTSPVTTSDPKLLIHLMEQFRTKWDTGKADDSTATRTFELNKRTRLYERLAEAYGIGLTMLDNPEALDALLKDWGASERHPDKNPWVYPVRLLFWSRTSDKKAGRALTPDKSAWKYAGVFRYCQEAGITQGEFARKVEAFSMRRFGKKLLGMQNMDRDKHRQSDPEMIELEQMRSRIISQAKPLVKVSAGKFRGPLEPGQLLALWGWIDEDRQVQIYDMMPKSSATVQRFLDHVAKDVETYIDRTVYKKIKPGPRNSLPKRASENVFKPMLAAEREALAREAEEDTRAAEAAKPKPAAKRNTIKVPKGASIGAAENELVTT